MPIIYDAPIVEQKSINSSEIIGFSVNLRDMVIDLMYLDGNRDINNVFTPIEEMKNIHLTGQEVSDIIINNPDIYNSLKILVNNLILQTKNTSGTII